MTEEVKKTTRRRRTKKVDVVTENLAETSHEVELPATGEVTREPEIIEPVDAPLDSDRGRLMEFMAQKVTIFLQDPQGDNPEPIVPVGVNGRVLYLKRGEQHTIPRAYVEVLARARRVNYQSVETTAPDGSRTTVMKASTTMQYPFSVIDDPDPRGPDWLKALMNEKV